MSTTNVIGGSIKKGEVRNVRELRAGLGADAETGYASIVIVSDSPAVMKALADLKDALRNAAYVYVEDVLQGQAAWDEVMAQRAVRKA